MIKRDIENQLQEMAKYFAVVAILGPRQSGKTTVAKKCFPLHTYLNLEDLTLRQYAKEDPKGFLKHYKNDNGIILDEFQNVPDILSYIQVMVDADFKPGYIILTGSQNFLMNNQISQSLAGRVSINTLLPFSIEELKNADLLQKNPEDLIYKGSYPPIYNRNIPVEDWYSSYVKTYLERDLRDLTQVSDLSTFQKFLQLCAARAGQLLNLSSISIECGISIPTVKRWLSILESCYLIFLLKPYHVNYNKRLVKTPKLYFFDTGLICSLLNIHENSLNTHQLRGALFENLIVADIVKNFYNMGKNPAIYFWRDRTGHEVDILLELKGQIYPIEIKATHTINTHLLDNVVFWNKLSNNNPENSYLIFAGDDSQTRLNGNILSWKNLNTIFSF